MDQFINYPTFPKQYVKLEFEKNVDIKFFRLLPPALNSFNLPLNGLYNDIDNTEEDTDNIIQNKFSDFSILPNNINIENILRIDPYFGKVFLNEKLNGLIMLMNNSELLLNLKKLDMSLTINAKQESKTKEQVLKYDIKFPKEGINVEKKSVFTIPINIPLDFATKYDILFTLKYGSDTYDKQYNKAIEQNYNIENKDKDFFIVQNHVELKHVKKLTFEVTYPFKVIEKFYNYQMNTCFIEVKISNITIYPLTISDIYLIPKSNPDNKITLVESLKNLSNSQIQFLFEDNPQNKSLSSSYLSLQSEEEVTLAFKISEPKLFLEEDKYILKIKWLNNFNSEEKQFSYEFGNTLNTFNDFYKLTVEQKPDKYIIKNENFKIVLKLETKNLQKKYSISLSQDSLRKNDISNDKEVEIIDILDKTIELNKNKPVNNFVLICKSDVLGNVYLPRLKFFLKEEGSNIPSGNVFDALLSFNCINKN